MRKKPFLRYKSKNSDEIKGKRSSFSPHKALSMLLAVLMSMTIFLYTGASAQAVKTDITLSISSSPEPSTYSENVTFTATLSNAAATGKVHFFDGDIEIGTAKISNGIAEFQTAWLTVGSHTIKAKYEGDAIFNPCDNHITQTVDKASLRWDWELKRLGYTYGDLVYVNVNWSSMNATGSVYIYLDDNVVSRGPATGNGFEKSYYDIPIGVHYFMLKYDGDSNYNRLQMGIGRPFIIDPASATIDLTSDKSTSKYGDPVTFTATMSKPGATGDMHFFDGYTEIGSGAISNGVATFRTSSLTVGSHSITARYYGDSNFYPCAGQMTQKVEKADVTLSFSSSKNPSLYSDPITFTATLSKPDATGAVSFADGLKSLGTVTVTDGKASLTVTDALSLGYHSIIAEYSGDNNYNGAGGIWNQIVEKGDIELSLVSSENPSQYGDIVIFTASWSPKSATGTVSLVVNGTTKVAPISAGVLTLEIPNFEVGSYDIKTAYAGDANYNEAHKLLVQIVNKADVALSLSSSENPSQYGNPVTFTATLSKTGATGTVSFFDGAQLLGITTVSAGGTASLTVSDTLSLGDHDIRADYSGDTNYNEASNHMTQTVGKADVVLSLSSSDNPSLYGAHVTFTAALSKIGATGTVSFFDGTTTLGSAPISDSTARLTTSALDAGNHDITAKYSGDLYYNSTSTSLQQTVDAVYTVHYINSLTGKSLAADKNGSGALGEIITEKAVSVNGYVVSGSQTQSITLSENTNSITFHYIPIGGIFAVYVIFIILLFGALMLPIILRLRGQI